MTRIRPEDVEGLPAINLTEPFVALAAEARRRLTDELRHELAPGHELYGRGVEVVGRCRGCDNHVVLVDGGSSWAVVHLSWKNPDRPPWPSTWIGSTWSDLAAEFDDHDH